MVRAKFTVVSVNSKSGEVILEPVYSGSEENKMFYEYTPAGKIVLVTVNEKALKEFEVGKEYYVDFILAN
jgi:hypothetical protein